MPPERALPLLQGTRPRVGKIADHQRKRNRGAIYDYIMTKDYRVIGLFKKVRVDNGGPIPPHDEEFSEQDIVLDEDTIIYFQ
ncbi:hypothetical protein NDU88_006253 [Pleurodeles waltl]|uniref:Uncharacterized protein n=1 Tax=Pleurodeles waltl TaxID=8319 RepID=A0AAV7RL20_PLEWA|nr:hypothetical protein NDU88_006253 [Pleurodeles waltl]